MFSSSATTSLHIAVLRTRTTKSPNVDGTSCAYGSGRAIGANFAAEANEERMPTTHRHALGTVVFLAQSCLRQQPSPKGGKLRNVPAMFSEQHIVGARALYGLVKGNN